MHCVHDFPWLFFTGAVVGATHSVASVGAAEEDNGLLFRLVGGDFNGVKSLPKFRAGSSRSWSKSGHVSTRRRRATSSAYEVREMSM